MAPRQKIGQGTLHALLEPALGAVLRDTGWSIVHVERERKLARGVVADCVARVRSGRTTVTLVIEVSAHPRPMAVREKALLLSHLARQADLRNPVAIVFFLARATPALAGLLSELDVGYLDPQGACHLRWPGLFIERRAPTRPAHGLGRPSTGGQSAFSPRAARRHRVLRAILSYPRRRWHQVELAAEAEVSVFTAHSTICSLLADHYADYDGTGPGKTVFLMRPRELLNAWVPFWRETWHRAHRAADSYYCLAGGADEICDLLARAARRTRTRVGLTLSAGASRYGSYLRDDLVHAYVAGSPGDLANAAQLDPARTGGNVLLYPARDEGTLYLPAPVRHALGIASAPWLAPVCPVQLYLDMQASGGRYAEQAVVLLEEVLGYEPARDGH